MASNNRIAPRLFLGRKPSLGLPAPGLRRMYRRAAATVLPSSITVTPADFADTNGDGVFLPPSPWLYDTIPAGNEPVWFSDVRVLGTTRPLSVSLAEQTNASSIGAQGPAGWSPVFAIIARGDDRVLQVTDWVGGGGTMPASDVYVGAGGLVTDIAQAINIRGPAGEVTEGGGGVDEAAVLALVEDWAEQGNTDLIPGEKLTNAISAAFRRTLDQYPEGQVDAFSVLAQRTNATLHRFAGDIAKISATLFRSPVLNIPENLLTADFTVDMFQLIDQGASPGANLVAQVTTIPSTSEIIGAATKAFAFRLSPPGGEVIEGYLPLTADQDSPYNFTVPSLMTAGASTDWYVPFRALSAATPLNGTIPIEIVLFEQEGFIEEDFSVPEMVSTRLSTLENAPPAVDDAAVLALIADWAEEGNAEIIPQGKIPMGTQGNPFQYLQHWTATTDPALVVPSLTSADAVADRTVAANEELVFQLLPAGQTSPNTTILADIPVFTRLAGEVLYTVEAVSHVEILFRFVVFAGEPGEFTTTRSFIERLRSAELESNALVAFNSERILPPGTPSLDRTEYPIRAELVIRGYSANDSTVRADITLGSLQLQTPSLTIFQPAGYGNTVSWAQNQNTEQIPANKLELAPGGDGGGLTEGQVDARIAALVDTWAIQANAAEDIPDAKIPDDIARDTELPTPGLSESQVDARIGTLVESWTLQANPAEDIPDGKIPDEIARDSELPTPGLDEEAVRALVEDWAEQGNTDQIPADKLQNAPSGGDGGGPDPRELFVATYAADFHNTERGTGILGNVETNRLGNVTVAETLIPNIVPTAESVAAGGDDRNLTFAANTPAAWTATADGLYTFVVRFNFPNLPETSTRIWPRLERMIGSGGWDWVDVSAYIRTGQGGSTGGQYHTFRYLARLVSGDTVSLRISFTDDEFGNDFPGMQTTELRQQAWRVLEANNAYALLNGSLTVEICESPTAVGGASSPTSGLDNDAVLALVEDWAEEGNTDQIPADKLQNAPSGGDGGGLTESQVDARVQALVETWAFLANSAEDIPDAKIPDDIARDTELPTPGLSQAEVDARIRALVESWTLQANAAEDIPDAKIPDEIARDTELPTPGLSQAEVDARIRALVESWTLQANSAEDIPDAKIPDEIARDSELPDPGLDDAAVRALVEDWAEEGNTDQIPAEKLQLAPSGGDGGGLTQEQVDARVQALVETWAFLANSAEDIPDAKIPDDIARDSELPTPGLSQAAVDARIRALVESWTLQANAAEDIPDAKIPDDIARDSELPTPGLSQAEVDARIRALIDSWAQTANPSEDIPDGKIPDEIARDSEIPDGQFTIQQRLFGPLELLQINVGGQVDNTSYRTPLFSIDEQKVLRLRDNSALLVSQFNANIETSSGPGPAQQPTFRVYEVLVETDAASTVTERRTLILELTQRELDTGTNARYTETHVFRSNSINSDTVSADIAYEFEIDNTAGTTLEFRVEINDPYSSISEILLDSIRVVDALPANADGAEGEVIFVTDGTADAGQVYRHSGTEWVSVLSGGTGDEGGEPTPVVATLSETLTVIRGTPIPGPPGVDLTPSTVVTIGLPANTPSYFDLPVDFREDDTLRFYFVFFNSDTTRKASIKVSEISTSVPIGNTDPGDATPLVSLATDASGAPGRWITVSRRVFNGRTQVFLHRGEPTGTFFQSSYRLTAIVHARQNIEVTGTAVGLPAGPDPRELFVATYAADFHNTERGTGILGNVETNRLGNVTGAETLIPNIVPTAESVAAGGDDRNLTFAANTPAAWTATADGLYTFVVRFNFPNLPETSTRIWPRLERMIGSGGWDWVDVSTYIRTGQGGSTGGQYHTFRYLARLVSGDTVSLRISFTDDEFGNDFPGMQTTELRQQAWRVLEANNAYALLNGSLTVEICELPTTAGGAGGSSAPIGEQQLPSTQTTQIIPGGITNTPADPFVVPSTGVTPLHAALEVPADASVYALLLTATTSSAIPLTFVYYTSATATTGYPASNNPFTFGGAAGAHVTSFSIPVGPDSLFTYEDGGERFVRVGFAGNSQGAVSFTGVTITAHFERPISEQTYPLDPLMVETPGDIPWPTYSNVPQATTIIGLNNGLVLNKAVHSHVSLRLSMANVAQRTVDLNVGQINFLTQANLMQDGEGTFYAFVYPTGIVETYMGNNYGGNDQALALADAAVRINFLRATDNHPDQCDKFAITILKNNENRIANSTSFNRIERVFGLPNLA